MATLIDTSVWIDVLRSAERAKAVRAAVDPDDVVLTRFIQLELLQGCRDESEWTKLDAYLATQIYLEATADTWPAAARIYFDARRAGRTVRSPIDCCIAQLAVENDAHLLHRDRDYHTIAEFSALSHTYLEW